MEKEKAPADENGEGAGKEAARATRRYELLRFQFHKWLFQKGNSM